MSPRHFVALAASVLCSCGTYGRAMFPPLEAGQARWTIPLVGPLTNTHAVVMAELEGEPGPTGARPKRSIPMTIDSGAGLTSLPRSVFDALGVQVVQAKHALVVDANGVTAYRQEGTVPRMKLGPLVLTEVPVAADNTSALLGYDILSRYPFELDFDRGRLIIGAEPLARSSSVTSIDLGSRHHQGWHLGVRLDGKEALMTLDTGAEDTSIDWETADALGLARQDLDSELHYRGVYSRSTIKQVYVAKQLEIGALRLGSRTLIPLEKHRQGSALNQKVVGLLGMDVLHCAHLRADLSDGRLDIAAREDLLKTASDRIRRWEWAAPCAAPTGCVQARLEDTHPGHTLVVRPTVKLDRAASFTFACGEEGTARIAFDVPTIVVEAAEVSPEHEARIRMDVDRHAKQILEAFDSKPSRCASLMLIDMEPIEWTEKAWRYSTSIHPPLGRICPAK